MIKVAPSILAADTLNLERDIRRVSEAGCDLLHVDIMDAHFVPNMSFAPAHVRAIHERFPELKLDVHLMMDNPEEYIERFMRSGAWGITIHREIPGDVQGMLRQIRLLGGSAGLSVKPGTPVREILPLLPECDMVLVMTVEPGFGGQQFRWDMLEKLRELRAAGYQGLIEADGGVTLHNLPDLKQAGLDVAVMGTAMFRSRQLAEDIARIHAM